jgi:hypothetical protein
MLSILLLSLPLFTLAFPPVNVNLCKSVKTTPEFKACMQFDNKKAKLLRRRIGDTYATSCLCPVVVSELGEVMSWHLVDLQGGEQGGCKSGMSADILGMELNPIAVNTYLCDQKNST